VQTTLECLCKEAIRVNFREKDPGSYMMEKAVGKKLAELSVKVLF
jgi:hypothetical protein